MGSEPGTCVSDTVSEGEHGGATHAPCENLVKVSGFFTVRFFYWCESTTQINNSNVQKLRRWFPEWGAVRGTAVQKRVHCMQPTRSNADHGDLKKSAFFVLFKLWGDIRDDAQKFV